MKWREIRFMIKKYERVDSLNVLRVTAMMLVFMRHVFSFTVEHGVEINQKTWLMYTPAWAGVWIFFILSGYLTGYNFYNEKYELNIEGVLRFWKKRIKKIVLPTYFFYFITCLFFNPRFIIENKSVILDLLFFTYNGSPGMEGIGVTWYISSLIQLYILAPFLYYIVMSILNCCRKKCFKYIFMGMVIILGLFIRLWLYKEQASWYSCIYTPFYANLDLFICGMCLNWVKSEERIYSIRDSFISYILLFGLVLANTRLYFINPGGKDFYYRYLLPSLYIVIIGVFIVVNSCMQKTTKCRYNKLKIKLVKIIDFLAGISFEFYLFHTIIIDRVVILIGEWNNYLIFHLVVLVISFVFTCVISVAYKKIFEVSKNNINI